MAEQKQQLVKSLVHQCYHYIAMNLEKFPISYLSLLPLKMREDLLWRLPIADLCQLEDTEYVEGFQDMAAYWKLPCSDFMRVPLGYPNVARYVEEWDSVEYAKALLYGQIAITAFGCLYDPFLDLVYCSICLPFNGRLDPNSRSVVIPFLYAVRKPVNRVGNGCDLVLPPRYRDKASYMTSKEDIVKCVQSWFKSGFPKIMLQVCMCDDIDDEYVDLLEEVALIGTNFQGFQHPTMRLVEQAVLRSSCLEVIVLDSWVECENEPVLNDFLKFLSTQDNFLSRFRLLVITQDEDCTYTIFQENLGPLIAAYFSAPTTHQQKIKITSAKIKSYNADITPAIDQRYVQFKTIEMKNCCYVSKRKFSQKAITEWLGEEISVLNVDEKEVDSLTFKIRERAPGVLNHKKRKHSEVDNEEPNQKL